MKVWDFNFNKSLLDKKWYEKSCENILIYGILYKTYMSAKPLPIRFDKIDGFIKVYDVTRYLVLFGPERYDASYNKIRNLISKKGGITYTAGHNFLRIRIDSYNFSPSEKASIFHNIITLTE